MLTRHARGQVYAADLQPIASARSIADGDLARLDVLARYLAALHTPILGAHDYSDSNRDELYRILADLATMLAAQDVVVLVAATAPKRAHRAHARGLGGAFVDTRPPTAARS